MSAAGWVVDAGVTIMAHVTMGIPHVCVTLQYSKTVQHVFSTATLDNTSHHNTTHVIGGKKVRTSDCDCSCLLANSTDRTTLHGSGALDVL